MANSPKPYLLTLNGIRSAQNVRGQDVAEAFDQVSTSLQSLHDLVMSQKAAPAPVATPVRPIGPALPVPITSPKSTTTAATNFLFTQSVAAAVWIINHNLNTTPLNVTAMDSTNSEVMVQTVFNSANQVTLTFSAPESGTAFISI